MIDVSKIDQLPEIEYVSYCTQTLAIFDKITNSEEREDFRNSMAQGYILIKDTPSELGFYNKARVATSVYTAMDFIDGQLVNLSISGTPYGPLKKSTVKTRYKEMLKFIIMLYHERGGQIIMQSKNEIEAKIRDDYILTLGWKQNLNKNYFVYFWCTAID